MPTVPVDDIESVASTSGIHNLKEEMLSNSKEFKDFAYLIANQRPGSVTQIGYACTVASIADKYNIPYKRYAGTCITKTSPKYDELVDQFNRGKAEGKEHPLIATHVYITINGKTYEYFIGFDDIEHLDVVEF